MNATNVDRSKTNAQRFSELNLAGTDVFWFRLQRSVRIVVELQSLSKSHVDSIHSDYELHFLRVRQAQINLNSDRCLGQVVEWSGKDDSCYMRKIEKQFNDTYRVSEKQYHFMLRTAQFQLDVIAANFSFLVISKDYLHGPISQSGGESIV